MRKLLILALLWLLIECLIAHASIIEGTYTYENYLFVLVHGLNADEGVFEGKTPYGNLVNRLENDLGLKGRVFAYSFNDKNGSNLDHAKELADPTNPSNWLNRARNEYLDYSKHPENRGKPVPTKYVLITHSMGNLAARSYIYSDDVFGKGNGFYRDNIEKVVFIAPPLLGSDMTWMTAKMHYYDVPSGAISILNDGVKYKYDEAVDFIRYLMDYRSPFSIYSAVGVLVAAQIYGKQALDQQFGLNTLRPWWPGMQELMPSSNLVAVLKEAALSDPTMEPAYSIVYGQGIPVYDYGVSFGVSGMKYLNDKEARDSFAQLAALRGSDYVDPSGRAYGNMFSQFVSLDWQWLTLMHPNFYGLSTSQAKLMAFLQAAAFKGYFTNDGDGLVPVYSAKGEGIKHLKQAFRHEYTFRTPAVDDYFSGPFLAELAVTEGAIYTTAALSGMPPQNYWYFRIPLALAVTYTVLSNGPNLQWDIEAHGHILEQYDLIEKAILDTPAIFTVKDLQAIASPESSATPEATIKVFSAGAPVTAGYESIKIRSVAGFTSMPVPMTLKALTASATAEGERKYVTQNVISNILLKERICHV